MLTSLCVCTLSPECVPVHLCECDDRFSTNSISIISYGFLLHSGVFCQDMIDSCWAKQVLSDVRLCVWPSLNRSAVSDLCLSHRRTVGHLWGKWQTTQRSALGFVCVCYSTLQWCLSGECVSKVSRGKASLPATLLYIHHSCWWRAVCLISPGDPSCRRPLTAPSHELLWAVSPLVSHLPPWSCP